VQSHPRAQVVSYPFQPLEKIKLQQAQAANEGKDGDGQNDGSAFEGFELHDIGLNKKPEQLKAALVLLKFFIA
jgi:hypothetical protein